MSYAKPNQYVSNTDIEQPTPQGALDQRVNCVIETFVETYNIVNPTKSFRFNSYRDYLAYKQAQITRGPALGKMNMVISVPDNAHRTVTLPFTMTGKQYIYINWGDGSPVTRYYAYATHTYRINGNYNITINGSATGYGVGFSSSSPSGNPIIISVDSWLDTLQSLSGAFSWQSNIVRLPPKLPPSVTDLSYLFYQSSGFNYYISCWDVSNIVNMEYMFCGASSFNGNLSSWNVSRVTNMAGMFASAAAFNQDLSSWTLLSITNARSIFESATLMAANTAYWPYFHDFNGSLPVAGDPYYTAA
jgi:surface protein